MTIQSRLQTLFGEWRRRTFPPSVADVSWRHEFIAKRLALIEDAIFKQLVATQASPLVQAEVLAVLRLIEPKQAVGCKKIRVGSVADGGYVQIADLTAITHALSFGVCDDDSWDLAMAESGIPVEQFDHSIATAPSSHPLLNFHRKMISADATPGSATLPDLAAAYSKETADLILKIDIEGCEWDIFDRVGDATLGKFAQIICEFHDLSLLAEDKFRARARRVFEKLAAHFAAVHVHANNCGKIYVVANIALPDILEISFASRSRYAFADTDERFPTPLDAPNNRHLPEIVLGAFRF